MGQKVLVLRTCRADGTSYGGFFWPESGPVDCPDWQPTPECGNGLHGLLWGEGDGTLLNWGKDARWKVVEVEDEAIVSLNGKVKFPRGNVLHTGTQETATRFLLENGGAGKAVVGASVTAGDYGTATAGDYGTATAGDYGTATAGYYGTATAGDYGTATAGYKGTATAGYKGTATAGYYGTAMAGDKGTIQIRWLDTKGERWRIVTGYVGENGIEPNNAYQLNGEHQFIPAGGKKS
jgi:hypothetical protein